MSLMVEDAVVYVVDDDEDVRRALGMLLESVGHTVIEFPSAEAFLAAPRTDKPACLILDIHMPSTSGIELQERLNQGSDELPVIFLTGHGNVPNAVSALKLGAIDFLEKPLRSDEQLLQRVREALAIDAAAKARLAREDAAKSVIALLTRREAQVFEFLCQGMANKVIGIELGISERTVELHRSHVMKKMGARSIAELIHLRDAAQGEIGQS